ncbi:HEPN domain-containing protein [Burkholderia gladioli]|uniref:HEPN domain-containing protein n=1 Tax=Burkholderia gladioli TaxID=28095 RepID=A0AB38TKQ1_BURGA|nr:HEPN domain-containing protein [Burkholderia gladioli]MBU9191285.1 HEPN domain-containing protein [Burkholderia gladioli]MBU9266754.1 HEPN domain-containing protein [Burkholderia gladioli]MBU9274496.1 HEPN domain-containing protein [Burkholderia gladioli]MCA8170916.1 HEPN domain-containing protein [Burkholderia gladioli]MDN7807643.1 HEPN domain-containing protein [Burkholderia gladioli]
MKLTSNHLELDRKLSQLGWTTVELRQFAIEVGMRWFELGRQHLDEAVRLHAAGCPRASFSRAYYGAYNASKAVRYLVKGIVSLKGDDHGKASIDLPDDFPDVARWSSKISVLYEHRLRADYDNWATTGTEQILNPDVAINDAAQFMDAARTYLNTKFGIPL